MAKPSRRRRYSAQQPTYHKLNKQQKKEHNSILQWLLGITPEEPASRENLEDRSRVPRRHRSGD